MDEASEREQPTDEVVAEDGRLQLPAKKRHHGVSEHEVRNEFEGNSTTRPERPSGDILLGIKVREDFAGVRGVAKALDDLDTPKKERKREKESVMADRAARLHPHVREAHPVRG